MLIKQNLILNLINELIFQEERIMYQNKYE